LVKGSRISYSEWSGQTHAFKCEMQLNIVHLQYSMQFVKRVDLTLLFPRPFCSHLDELIVY